MVLTFGEISFLWVKLQCILIKDGEIMKSMTSVMNHRRHIFVMTSRSLIEIIFWYSYQNKVSIELHFLKWRKVSS